MNLQELVKDYLNHMSHVDIQSKYKINYRNLLKLLKEQGIFKRCLSTMYSPDKMKFIKENYLIMSNNDIAKIIGVQSDGIRLAARRLQLPKKGSGWKYNPELEKLDKTTNEFYYFLGWMASDGNVSKNLQNISLKICDEEIVNRFLLMFPTAKKYITPYSYKKTSYCFMIGSMEFSRFLITKGITPHKSRTLDVTEDCWNEHFVRGFFEGDGHVRQNFPHNRYTRYSAGFCCASEKFIKDLSKYLECKGIINKVVQEKTYFRLRIEGKECLKIFYHLLYDNSNQWFLLRKKQILDQLFSNE